MQEIFICLTYCIHVTAAASVTIYNITGGSNGMVGTWRTAALCCRHVSTQKCACTLMGMHRYAHMKEFSTLTFMSSSSPVYRLEAVALL